MKKVTAFRYLLYLSLVCAATSAFAQYATLFSDVWKLSSQRDALMPKGYVDQDVKFQVAATLAVEGGGKETCNGNWYTHVEIEPSAFYEFKAYFFHKKPAWNWCTDGMRMVKYISEESQ
jgi:hypothetical protein